MSTTPQTTASPHADTFLVYLSAHPNIRPSHTLVARAAATGKLPAFSYTLPSGTIAAFPEFLAFLTQEKASPGTGVIWNLLVDQTRTLLTLHRWAYHPASILTDIAKILGATAFGNEDKLAAALANRNSFFIPLERLTGVTVGRRSAREGRQFYLTLTTLDGTYMICEDAATEGWFTSMGSMLGLSPWQPQLIALLQSAAGLNAAKPRAGKAQAASTAPHPQGSSTATAASAHTSSASAPPRTASAAGPAGSARAGTPSSTPPGARSALGGIGSPQRPPVAPARGPAASPNVQIHMPAGAKAQAATASAARPRQRSGGCGALILLLLVGLIAGGIALSQHHGNAGGSGGSSNVPDVSGSYTGTADNSRGTSAPMTLTLDQQGTGLSGSFAVSNPLGGSGPLQGQVDDSGDVTFEVTSADGTGVTIDFSGSLSASGTELTGSYTVNNGQSGTWDVTR